MLHGKVKKYKSIDRKYTQRLVLGLHKNEQNMMIQNDDAE